MIRYIVLFVLTLIAASANAQTTVYYNGNPYVESDNKMVIRLKDEYHLEEYVNTLNEKISSDTDFVSGGFGGGYFILDRKTGSTISKIDAINNYINEDYVAYVSFVFETDENDFWAVADDIFVKLKPGVGLEEVVSTTTPMGLESYQAFRSDLNIYKLHFSKTQATIQTAIDLYATDLFEYAEPNYLNNVVKPSVGEYGPRTNSGTGECNCIDNTLDPYVNAVPTIPPSTNKDYSQWGIYTGTKPGEFNDYYLLPYNGSGQVAEWADINVCHAWEFRHGSRAFPHKGGPVEISGNGIFVAVSDDGVDTKHRDLSMRYDGSGNVYGYDAAANLGLTVNPVYTGSAYDPGCLDQLTPFVAHGTCVSGIIAGKRNNILPGFGTNFGMAGVAYNSKIMPIHSFYRPNTSYILPISTSQSLADGIFWAADEGAHVINCSWGVGSYHTITSNPHPLAASSGLVEDAIDYAVQNGRDGKGCVIVFGSGNNNYNKISWPSSHDDVISVGASTMCHERKMAGAPPIDPGPVLYGSLGSESCDGETEWGSNYGDGTPYYDPLDPSTPRTLKTGGKLSVMAPGVKIVTTNYAPEFWPSFNGTSAAAPYVSGVVALMLEANECLTYKEVKDILELSADKVEPPGAIPGSFYPYTSGSPNGTYNNQMGYGKVNAGNAVTLAYDLYKQNKIELTTAFYKSKHYIFAGKNVTDILPSNWYIVTTGANVTFHAPTTEAIILDPGFLAASGSTFVAELYNDPCDNTHSHYKKPPQDKTIHKVANAAKKSQVTFVNVYPNPAKDKINIDFTLEENAEVTFLVSNIMGQKMMDAVSGKYNAGKNLRTLSTTNLVPGVYLISVKTPKGYSQFKFVKE